MIQTIFFDFGNVVAFFDHQRAINQIARYTDMAPAELMLALYGSPIEDQYERNQISTAEYVRLARLHGRLTCSEAVFLAAFVDIFWRNDEACELIPRLARRYRLVLASNTNEAHFGRFTEQFADVLTHFAHLGTSHRAGARKPEPAFFAYCQRYAEVEPARCLFIDDLPANVEAAQRHGWQAVCYQSRGQLAEQLRAAGVQLD